MVRVVKSFLVGVVALLIVFSGYEIYKVSPREFFPDTLTFAYVNENVKSMEIDDFLEFLENEGYNLNREKIKNTQKKIEGIYLLETASFFETEKNPVLVLDVGLRYPIYYFRIKEYFNFTGKNYILKPEYRKDVGLEELGIGEIFMRPYRGNYIFSDKSERIDEVINERTAMSEDGKSFLSSKEYGNLGILFFNFKRDGAYGLSTLSVVLNYKKNSLSTYSILSFKELELETPEEGYKNGLVRYIGENTLYIRIKDYVKAYDVGRRYIKKNRQLDFLIGYWQSVLGVDLLRLLEDIDQESVYNFQEKSGIVRFNKRERIDKVVQWIAYKNSLGLDMGMEREGNYLYFGEKRLIPKRENLTELKDNQILYYSRNYEGKEMKFEVFNLRYAARIQGRVNDEILSEMIKRFEKIGRRVE